MSNAIISCVKVRNRFKKTHPELDTQLKNIRVNRKLREYSGFINIFQEDLANKGEDELNKVWTLHTKCVYC